MTTATPSAQRVTKWEIAVLGLIALGGLALLVPALSLSRDRARLNLCRRNLRWLDQATADYIGIHNDLPSALTWPYQLLPRYQDVMGQTRRRSGLSDVEMPRPMFYTCPARSDIGGRAGAVQPIHYSFIVDRHQPGPASRIQWRFRDRPLIIETDRPRHWYVGHELTFEQADEELQSQRGPHKDGVYLESDAKGNSYARQAGGADAGELAHGEGR